MRKIILNLLCLIKAFDFCLAGVGGFEALKPRLKQHKQK